MSRIYRVVIGRHADQDLGEIARHIALDNPQAAERWLEMVTRRIATLAHFPARCPVIPEARDEDRPFRHLMCGIYWIIFEIRDDRVRVLRFVHGARLFLLASLDDE